MQHTDRDVVCISKEYEHWVTNKVYKKGSRTIQMGWGERQDNGKRSVKWLDSLYKSYKSHFVVSFKFLPILKNLLVIKALNLISISFFVTKSSREINVSVLWISANLFLLLVLE